MHEGPKNIVRAELHGASTGLFGEKIVYVKLRDSAPLRLVVSPENSNLVAEFIKAKIPVYAVEDISTILIIPFGFAFSTFLLISTVVNE